MRYLTPGAGYETPREGRLESGIYDQAGIEAVGAWIAARLRPGDAVLLAGPMGAGKSTLARALIRAACGDPALDVPSPTYTLVQSFSAPSLVLHHFDLWRLDGPEGLAELGWDEALADVVIVEWPDRLKDAHVSGALLVELSIVGEESRRVTLSPWR